MFTFLILCAIIDAIFGGDKKRSAHRKVKRSYNSGNYRRRRKNTYWEQQEKFRNDLGYHQWLGYQ